MTVVAPQYTLKEACEILEVSPKELAKMTDLNPGTIKDALDHGKFNKNVVTAQLITGALGMEMHEIKWLKGVSGDGRPPLTGKSTIKKAVSAIAATAEHVTRHVFCFRCRLQLPLTTLQCDYCE